jgi:hypothetical protein
LVIVSRHKCYGTQSNQLIDEAQVVGIQILKLIDNEMLQM